MTSVFLRGVALAGLAETLASDAPGPDQRLHGPCFEPRNPAIPRARVYDISCEIAQDDEEHLRAMTGLRKRQKHLMRFLVESANPPAMRETAGDVARFNLGAILRVFDVAGGSLAVVTPEEVVAAEAHVRACLAEPVTWTRRDGTRATATLLPFDEDFPLRARRFLRAQPHVLDELLAVQFERGRGPLPLSGPERAMGYLLMWVVTHALDRAWTPPEVGAPSADRQVAP